MEWNGFQGSFNNAQGGGPAPSIKAVGDLDPRARRGDTQSTKGPGHGTEVPVGSVERVQWVRMQQQDMLAIAVICNWIDLWDGTCAAPVTYCSELSNVVDDEPWIDPCGCGGTYWGRLNRSCSMHARTRIQCIALHQTSRLHLLVLTTSPHQPPSMHCLAGCRLQSHTQPQ